MHKLFGVVLRGVVLGLLMVLVGCATPAAITKYRDETFKGPVDELKVIFLQGKFPRAEALLEQHNIGTPAWYGVIAKRTEENFLHNGMRIHATVSASDYSVRRLATSTPNAATLVLHPQHLMVRDSLFFSFEFQAQLFTPGQAKPVWQAVFMASDHQAADELSLKILNELVNLRLAVLTRSPAETTDGKKNSTFGGVLTR